MTSPFMGPLRPSQIKYAIYGRAGFGGLRFQRVLYAGWDFYPAPGIVAKDIYKLGLDLKTFRLPLVVAIREVMEKSIYRNFAEGGRPVPWQSLSEYAVKIRGSAEPILVRSGALRDVASSFEVWTITDNDASIRSLPTRVWYGNLHQAGYGSIEGTARRLLGPAAKNPEALEVAIGRLMMGAREPGQQSKFVIPQREFAMFQDEDVEAIQEIFIEWMERRADQVGRGWNIP